MNRLQEFLSRFYWQLGVDLGSRRCRFLRDNGIVLDEATAVARLRKRVSGRIKFLVFGQKAREIMNREPTQIEVILPIKRGGVADLQALEELVTYFLGEVHNVTDKYPKIFISKKR